MKWPVLFLSLCLVSLQVLAEDFDIERLRAQQQAELDAAQSELHRRARQPGADKAALLNEYNAQVDEITSRYKAQDTRGPEIDRTIAEGGKAPDGSDLIENTGSKPKEVRADVDLAAKTHEAGAAQAEKWRQQGHKVTEVRTESGEVYKYVNETTDTVLWNPETESSLEAKVRDHDAFSTEGGRQGTGNSTAIRDERGWYLDNEGKYVHAQEVGDMKTQAKSVNKAAQGAGTFDPKDPFFQQAEAMQKYKDPIQAGIVEPGDSPEVAQRKMDEWQQRANQEMAKAQEVAERRGDVREKVRENFQDSYDKTPVADPDMEAHNQGRAEDIGDARDRVRNSNAAQEAENVRHGADAIDEIDTTTASGDTTPGAGTADDLAGAGAADDAARAGKKPAVLTEGRSSFAEPTIGEKAGAIVDSAGRVLDATALVGQAADAATRQAGKAIDENRDLTASDAGEAALEAAGVTGMYDMGNKISTEENVKYERGEQGLGETVVNIGSRMGGAIADGLVNDPVQRAIEEEEAAAEREGREPSYVSSTAHAAAEIGGNVTGIRQIGDAIYETTTWDERADAAATQAALDQQINSQASLTDREIGNLQRELETLSTRGDLNDPGTIDRINQAWNELNDAHDRMNRIRDAANRNAGNISGETVDVVNRRADSRPRPEDIGDYVSQMIRDRTAQSGGGNDKDTGYDPTQDVGDDAGGSGIDLGTASGYQQDQKDNDPMVVASRDGGGYGDDGGVVIQRTAVGGDNVSREANEREGHRTRQGDHTGRDDASMDTGDVTNPLDALNDTITSVSDSVTGINRTIDEADEIADRIRDFGNDDDDHGHGNGAGMAPGTQVASGTPGYPPSGGSSPGGGGMTPTAGQPGGGAGGPRSGGQPGGGDNNGAGGNGMPQAGDDDLPPGDTVVVTSSGTADDGGGGAAPAGAPGAGGATSSGSGGYSAAPQDRVISGGSALAGRSVTGVRVTLNYDAYGIPDEFQIVYGGGSLANSGNTSGSGTLTGTGRGNDPNVTIRVITRNQSTAWEWDCRVEYFVQ